jgi:hypothetical protein
LIDEAGQPHRVKRMPETDLEIRWTILFHNPFYQSTAAFRRSCFEAAGRYKIEKLISEDHYLCCRSAAPETLQSLSCAIG